MGSHRVGHEWSDLAAAVINLHAEGQQPKHTALFWQTAKIHLVCFRVTDLIKQKKHLRNYREIRKRYGNPLYYPCLENPMDGGAWQSTVHGVAKSWTRFMGLQRVGHDWATEHTRKLHHFFRTHCSSLTCSSLPSEGNDLLSLQQNLQKARMDMHVLSIFLKDVGIINKERLLQLITC